MQIRESSECAVSRADSHSPACTSSASAADIDNFVRGTHRCVHRNKNPIPEGKSTSVHPCHPFGSTSSRRFRSVKCLASSSATFAQSRKNSTGSRSPFISVSAKRAIISQLWRQRNGSLATKSYARSIAYCSIFASASSSHQRGGQMQDTNGA